MSIVLVITIDLEGFAFRLASVQELDSLEEQGDISVGHYDIMRNTRGGLIGVVLNPADIRDGILGVSGHPKAHQGGILLPFSGGDLTDGSKIEEIQDFSAIMKISESEFRVYFYDVFKIGLVDAFVEVDQGWRNHECVRIRREGR